MLTQEERKRDRYLRNQYGMSLKERTKRERKQKHRCAICRKPTEECASKKGLHVDHWHALAKVKIKTAKVLNTNSWMAYNADFQRFGIHLPEQYLRVTMENKKKAVKEVRMRLRRMANRGLLCWPCNSGVHRWDDPVKLRRALHYMELYFRELICVIAEMNSE